MKSMGAWDFVGLGVFIITSFVTSVVLGPASTFGFESEDMQKPGAENRSAPMSGGALFADVERYAQFGVHRTGGEGDHATSRWMAEELEKAGYEVDLQSWKLRQFTLRASSLEVGGRSIDCFPFWYPTSTGPEGVSALLYSLASGSGSESLAGKIAFADGTYFTRERWSTGINDIVEEAARRGAAAIVMIVPNASNELAAINARDPYQQQPLPIPAVIVAGRDEAFLVEAAEKGLDASLVVDGEDRTDAAAFNVIGTLERGKEWIVVTTPSSGWFQCAGERGAGVALFLGLARWAAASDSQYSFMFIANSGHELDNIGAHHSMDDRAPPVEEVRCWIHLGASIGARDWELTDEGPKPLERVNTVGNLVGTPDLLPLLRSAFDGVEGYEPRSGEPIRGELRHFISAGYRSFGFFGGHFYFHTRMDSPATTSPELLEPIGEALVKSVVALER